jgi:uncharacterized integral membrane protein
LQFQVLPTSAAPSHHALGSKYPAGSTQNRSIHAYICSIWSMFYFSLSYEESIMNYKLILILILAGLSVIFIVQNVDVIEIRFLFWSIQMSRALLMFFLFAIGIIIGWFLQSFFKHSQGKMV